MEDSKDFIMKDIALYPQDDDDDAGDPNQIKHFLEEDQEFMVGFLYEGNKIFLIFYLLP